MPHRNDSANGPVPGRKFPSIQREIPPGTVEPDREKRLNGILTADELAAFAQDIEQLIVDIQYHTITEEVLSEIERQETARRRIPPPRLRIAD